MIITTIVIKYQYYIALISNKCSEALKSAQERLGALIINPLDDIRCEASDEILICKFGDIVGILYTVQQYAQ